MNIEDVLRWCGYCGEKLEEEQDGMLLQTLLEDGRLMGMLVHRWCGQLVQEEHKAERLYDGS